MDLQLVQDVVVLGVDVDADEVVVGVYGGPDNVCASVTFSFGDAAEQAANVARLRRWEQAETPLTLLVHEDAVRLFSERAIFDRALAAAE